MTISFSSTKSTKSAALYCFEVAAALCTAHVVAMLWVLRCNMLLLSYVGFAGNGLLLGQCLVIFSLVFAVACYAS